MFADDSNIFYVDSNRFDKYLTVESDQTCSAFLGLLQTQSYFQTHAVILPENSRNVSVHLIKTVTFFVNVRSNVTPV